LEVEELIDGVRGVTAIYSAVVEFTGPAGDRAPNLGAWDEEPSSTLGTTLELVVAVFVLVLNDELASHGCFVSRTGSSWETRMVVSPE
jgi:hypothetical protein